MFEKRAYSSGVDELVELVSRFPSPRAPGDAYPRISGRYLYWAGQLAGVRRLRRKVGEPDHYPGRIDAAVQQRQRPQKFSDGRAAADHADFSSPTAESRPTPPSWKFSSGTPRYPL